MMKKLSQKERHLHQPKRVNRSMAKQQMITDWMISKAVMKL